MLIYIYIAICIKVLNIQLYYPPGFLNWVVLGSSYSQVRAGSTTSLFAAGDSQAIGKSFGEFLGAAGFLVVSTGLGTLWWTNSLLLKMAIYSGISH